MDPHMQTIAEAIDIMIAPIQLIYWYIEAFYRLIIPPPMKSIDGETILVTGAVGGIGKEICKHLIRSGFNMKLVLWDVNATDLQRFAEELRIMGNGRGVKVFPFAVDISKKENIDEGCQKLRDVVGPVSIIFNNAGIVTKGNFLMQTCEQIEQTIAVNFMSHVWIVRQFLPGMVSNNHGRIVNTCSLLGLRAVPHIFPYVASKFAVNGYSECLRRELEMFENDGVHVTTVYPYIVKTPIIGSFDFKKSSVVPSNLMRFDEPDAVARKIVDGVRREYEYIYFPSFAPIVLLLESLLPTKFRKACQSYYFDLFEYTDQKDWIYSTTFSQIIEKNGSDCDIVRKSV